MLITQNLLSGFIKLFFFFFLCTAQEQSKIYPSHSYNTSLNPPPNPVPPPAEEDLGGPRQNGDQHKHETVVNFTNEATRDTITLHTGKAIESPLNLLLKAMLVLPSAP